MSTVLIIVLILLAFGAFGTFPAWGYSRGFGYGPSGIIGAILVIVLVVYLLGGRI